MFGIHLTCSNCPFDLLTGWNHHGPGVTVVCADCGQRIELTGNADSPFSAGSQPCDVRLVVESPEEPDGVVVGPIIGAAVIRAAGLDEKFGAIPTEIDLQCPSCNSPEIVGGLAAGNPCPSCKLGTISHGGMAIY